MSTPTPGNRRRRELMRHSRCPTGTPELLNATPTSSRSSTPARSRNSTPQRNRVRCTPVQLLSPVLTRQLEAMDSFVPTSPPPPYEINLDSPFHVVRMVEENATLSTRESSDHPLVTEVSEIQTLPSEPECGCPGACGCGPPSLNFSMDSTAPLLRNLSLLSQQALDSIAPIEELLSEDHEEQQSVKLLLPDGNYNEAINHRLVHFSLSMDRIQRPALDKIKKIPRSKSF